MNKYRENYTPEPEEPAAFWQYLIAALLAVLFVAMLVYGWTA